MQKILFLYLLAYSQFFVVDTYNPVVLILTAISVAVTIFSIIVSIISIVVSIKLLKPKPPPKIKCKNSKGQNNNQRSF